MIPFPSLSNGCRLLKVSLSQRSEKDIHRRSSGVQGPRVRASSCRPLQVYDHICWRSAAEGSIKEAGIRRGNRILLQTLHNGAGRSRHKDGKA